MIRKNKAIISYQMTVNGLWLYVSGSNVCQLVCKRVIYGTAKMKFLSGLNKYFL